MSGFSEKEHKGQTNYKLLLKLLEIPNSEQIRILDAGAGGGYIIQDAKDIGLDKVKFTLLDIMYDPELRKRVHENKGWDYNPEKEARTNAPGSEMIAGNMYKPPFTPKSFDYAIFECPLMASPEQKKYLIDRIARLTKGKLVVPDPVEPLPSSIIRIDNGLPDPQTKIFKRSSEILAEMGWKLVKTHISPDPNLYGGIIESVFSTPESS